MCAYPGGHTGLVVVALATHALLGYTLGAILFDRPWIGLVGGVVADADFLFPAAWGAPFVHRGITHTALAAVVAVAIAALASRRAAGAVGAGYASHLLIDSTTEQAIPLAYPLSAAHVGVTLRGHAPAATVALWACSIGALWWRRRRADHDRRSVRQRG